MRTKKSGNTTSRGTRSPKAASDRSVAEQAKCHSHARRVRALETAEDYVEAIAALIDQTGEARAIDLARRLGVTHVTVGRTIARLQRSGLVTAKPYRAIFLTEEGRSLADSVRQRHQVVFEFLKAVGVPEATAQIDAEGIEHHVSDETLEVFAKFLKKK